MDPDMNINGFTGPTTRSEYPANYAYWSGYTDTGADAVTGASAEE